MRTREFYEESELWTELTAGSTVNRGDTVVVFGNNDTIEGIVDGVTSNQESFRFETGPVYRTGNKIMFKKLIEDASKYNWSAPRKVAKSLFKDYLRPQLERRYGMYDINETNRADTVIDSFIPDLVLRTGNDMGYAQRTIKDNIRNPKTISPWFSTMYNVPLIPAEELFKVLGYTKRRLTTLMTNVKARQLKMLFIGYGGTNVNTLYWLTEAAKLVGTNDIFKVLTIYEPDRLDISNLFRLPKDVSYIPRNTEKLSLFNEERMLCRYNTGISHAYIEEDHVHGYSDSNYIAYGAPDIETRDMLSSFHLPLIAATHGSDECSLHLNPAQDTGLQVESYGMIELNRFFMNQIRMAIGLLELLANEKTDLHSEDTEVMSFSFNDDTRLKLKDTYDFALQDNSDTSRTVVTAETPEDEDGDETGPEDEATIPEATGILGTLGGSPWARPTVDWSNLVMREHSMEDVATAEPTAIAVDSIIPPLDPTDLQTIRDRRAAITRVHQEMNTRPRF